MRRAFNVRNFEFSILVRRNFLEGIFLSKAKFLEGIFRGRGAVGRRKKLSRCEGKNVASGAGLR